MILYDNQKRIRRYTPVARRQIHRRPKMFSLDVSILVRRMPEPQRWKLPIRAAGYLKRLHTYHPMGFNEPPVALIWKLKGLA